MKNILNLGKLILIAENDFEKDYLKKISLNKMKYIAQYNDEGKVSQLEFSERINSIYDPIKIKDLGYIEINDGLDELI